MLRAAIIGTREPDTFQFKTARILASLLSRDLGYTITTGGAYGIDQAAMESAAPGMLTVYLPWERYNEHLIPSHARRVVYSPKIHKDWAASVLKYYPAPGRLSRGAMALHARNYGIVENTVAVNAFPNEIGGGGTAQGVRVALGLGIPVLQANKGSAEPVFVELIAKVLWTIKWGIAHENLSLATAWDDSLEAQAKVMAEAEGLLLT